MFTSSLSGSFIICDVSPPGGNTPVTSKCTSANSRVCLSHWGEGGATNQSEIWTSCNIEEITIGLRWHLPSVFWVCNINEEHHSLTDQFWWRETEVLPPGGSTSLLMKLPDNEEVNILMVINLSCLY